MKVILLEDVRNLGKAGDIKEVKNGYGFNFLLPNALAEFATPQTIRQAEEMIRKRRAEEQTLSAGWQKTAQALADKKVVIQTKAEGGKLFGSVGQAEIASALSVMGIAVNADVIIMDKPFKKTGVFPVRARFAEGIEASFEVMIESE